ncbi:hypothetical protein [Exiguobacterium acetylicum]|uniref:hypothetical protein n=1 Tax=Exiguobacterium acetylicum TaxID=41170 RepID=UPI001EE34AA1|nr:hypothetical protein [Exiguobacterium acetylicum]UKS57651.1 hypothetical protein K6T22_07200 [Exiguobacterium acetylicum]
MRWKEKMLQFETLREAEVWADSIANEMHDRSITGYGTPDFKVATILVFYLAQVPESRVHTAIVPLDAEMFYQVWIEIEDNL